MLHSGTVMGIVNHYYIPLSYIYYNVKIMNREVEES